MNNQCAFCTQIVDPFIRCAKCGEAICADHRGVKSAPTTHLMDAEHP